MYVNGHVQIRGRMNPRKNLRGERVKVKLQTPMLLTVPRWNFYCSFPSLVCSVFNVLPIFIFVTSFYIVQLLFCGMNGLCSVVVVSCDPHIRLSRSREIRRRRRRTGSIKCWSHGSIKFWGSSRWLIRMVPCCTEVYGNYLAAVLYFTIAYELMKIIPREYD